MKFPLLLLIVGFGVMLCACTSPKKEEPDEASTSEPVARPPAIAPGTARAFALVLGYEEKDTHYVGTLKIQRVDEYGASTPALPVGTEIVVVIPKALFDEDPDGTKASAMLATDHAVAVTLKHQLAAVVGDEPPPPSWRAIALR